MDLLDTWTGTWPSIPSLQAGYVLQQTDAREYFFIAAYPNTEQSKIYILWIWYKLLIHYDCKNCNVSQHPVTRTLPTPPEPTHSVQFVEACRQEFGRWAGGCDTRRSPAGGGCSSTGTRLRCPPSTTRQAPPPALPPAGSQRWHRPTVTGSSPWGRVRSERREREGFLRESEQKREK